MNNLPKDRKELFSLAELAGWDISHTNGGHIKLRNPSNGCCVIAAKTPSDHRAEMNLRSELKRAGLSPELIERAKENATQDTTEYFTMPASNGHDKQERNAIFPVIREVLSKYSRALTPDEFWPQVAAKMPKDYPKGLFLRAISNGKSRGVLIGSEGKYQLADGKARKVEPALPTNEDQLALLDALKALETLKAIVEKYQRVDMTREGMMTAARAELLEKLK